LARPPKRSFSLFASISLCGCFGTATSAHALDEAHAGQVVMGTILDVTVIADDAETARTLAARSVAIARHWDDVLTTWRSEGELARLNALAGKGAVVVSPDLRFALERMVALSRATRGLFDPAVGGVVNDLRSRSAHEARRITPITDALELAGDRATLRAPTELDAGGIGKGIALDAIAGELRVRGAGAWFLNFGGSSQLAHGSPRAGKDWEVAVAGLHAGSVHGFMALHESSLSTSRAVAADEPAGAMVDPRSGTYVAPPRLATVLAADATTAEAWSKALLILGREGFELLRAAGLQGLYEDVNGVVVTPDFPLAHRSDAAPLPLPDARGADGVPQPATSGR
jgi:thiamine biosynthesis lipoprotein